MLSPISRRLLLIGVRRASLSAQKLLVALDNKVLCPKRSTPSKALNFSPVKTFNPLSKAK